MESQFNMNWTSHIQLGALIAMLACTALSCRHDLRVYTGPRYVPSYAYQSSDVSAVKHDVTLIIIGPQIDPAHARVRGADGRDMLNAIPTALADLITAKGMKFRGPVDSWDEMTFPDKKGSDLGIYAKIAFSAGWEPINLRIDRNRMRCDVRVWCKGAVQFLVIEPISRETMWTKTVHLKMKPAEVVVANQSGNACGFAMGGMASLVPPPAPSNVAQGSDEPSPEGPVGDMYRHGLERAFYDTMKGIDNFMTADEFEILKSQSQELRDKNLLGHGQGKN